MRIRLFFSIACLSLLLSSTNCRHDRPADQQTETAMPSQTIEQVQEKYQDHWMALPGVVGVAIGENEGELVLKVMVVKITPELEQKIPKNADGYEVMVEETGEIRALDQ